LFAWGGLFFDQTYQSAIFRRGVLMRLLEARMLVRRVIDDQIDYDANSALLGGVREFDKVA
jgi:hypothetical protein